MSNQNEPSSALCGAPRSALRSPTRGDLIALLTWSASQAGCALNEYRNDRDPSRADKLEKRLEEMQSRLYRAAGYFPPPRRSPWTS